tara:strand:- start:264 stop:1001 length:738 start_codon:yes stop_codon:yes gene_type:complete
MCIVAAAPAAGVGAAAGAGAAASAGAAIMGLKGATASAVASTTAGSVASAGLSAAAAAALKQLLVSGLTMAVGQIGQAQQTSAYNKMMSERQRRGTRLARENFESQILQAYTRTSQEREAAADEIQKVASEGRKAAALASLSAGERGVAGRGIDQIYADFEAQELRYQTQVKKSLSFREQAIRDNLEQARRGAQSNIMNLQFMPRTGPNLLAGALQVAGSAYGAYNQYSFQGPDPRITPSNVGQS